jgi:hypothetical protein
MREDSGQPPGSTPASPPASQYPPLPVRSTRVILVGMAAWGVALVVILLIPDLRSGDRSWWPWTCVAGLVLGLVGYLYIRRGRGNAAGVT